MIFFLRNNLFEKKIKTIGKVALGSKKSPKNQSSKENRCSPQENKALCVQKQKRKIKSETSSSRTCVQSTRQSVLYKTSLMKSRKVFAKLCPKNKTRQENPSLGLASRTKFGQNDPFGSTIKSLKDCALCGSQCHSDSIIMNFAIVHSFFSFSLLVRIGLVLVCLSMPFDIVYCVHHWNVSTCVWQIEQMSDRESVCVICRLLFSFFASQFPVLFSFFFLCRWISDGRISHQPHS